MKRGTDGNGIVTTSLELVSGWKHDEGTIPGTVTVLPPGPLLTAVPPEPFPNDTPLIDKLNASRKEAVGSRPVATRQQRISCIDYSINYVLGLRLENG